MSLPLKRRILIVTAVEAEKEAVLRGLNRDSDIDVFAAGVGPVLAAVNTTKALAKTKYDLVISAGIAGGFAGKTDLGSVVIAQEIVAADLGAQSPEGFCSLDELGFGSTRIKVDSLLVNKVSEAFIAADMSVNSGSILTVCTVTGSSETAKALAQREPEAVAEAMEGYGVAVAAVESGIPVMEVRTISNFVGPRDRSSWRIKDALESLTAASALLMEVFKNEDCFFSVPE